MFRVGWRERSVVKGEIMRRILLPASFILKMG